MSAVRLWEVHVMRGMQSVLQPLESTLTSACHLGDPRYPYLILFPFALAFSREVAFKVLWAVSISEWLNVIFKWLLSDDRPYWWVKEYFDDGDDLKQLSISCETGPGSPSGHLMVSSTIWFLIISQLIAFKVIDSKCGRYLSFIVYNAVLLSIAMGRVYVSAHFPDQCILGYVVGTIVGYFVNKHISRRKLKFVNHLWTALFLPIVAYSVYMGLNLYGSKDADWSLRLAEKWCIEPQFVKPDTTPLFVVWRTTGAILGTGFAFYACAGYLRHKDGTKSANVEGKKVQIAKGLFATFVVWLFFDLTRIDPSFEDAMRYFYVVTFLQNAFLPIVASAAIYAFDYVVFKTNKMKI